MQWDIYVYQLKNNKLNLIYTEADIGANQGVFSNDKKRLAYWPRNTGGLCILDLKTKKRSVYRFSLDPQGRGDCSAWSRNDKSIYIAYVMRDDTKYYVISNL